jgi:CrcB protein
VRSWIAVVLGGALGSGARHGINMLVVRFGHPAHYATLIVNVVGCAVIGVLAGAVVSGRIEMSNEARTFVFVGILGGLTTFSTFGLDTFTLARTGRFATAGWNVAAQLILGLSAVAAGYFLALWLGRTGD